MNTRQVVLCNPVRTAIGTYGGGLKDVPAPDLGAVVIREALKRSGGRQLHAFIEIGEDHGGMCFGDGVQHATGCTLGKGNMDKTPFGKLAVTVVERATNRAIRVS